MKYYLKMYNNDNMRIYSHIGKDKKFFKNDKNNKISEEEKERISISRTKRNIRELALCNDWEYFVTWTVDSKNADRFSLQSTQDLMHKTLKAYQRKHKDFKYLFITEKHKNGAFHFHGFIKNIGSYKINNNGFLTISHFEEKVGFFSMSQIKDYTKCCNYITKYITKDCIKNEKNQIYFCSKGLKKAESEEIFGFDYQFFKDYFMDFSFRNDYSQIVDFKVSELTNIQKFYLSQLNFKKDIDF